jgi:hypothetical protein
VDGGRVSIYNEAVHPKHPLLGLKFKNATGKPLPQGPVTVFEGNGYAGDARLPDLQPNEERLVAYAIDLGTEVKGEGKAEPDRLTALKIVKGVLQASYKLRMTRSYLAKNRSAQERTLVIEHPVRQGWALVAPEKPERSRDVYRLEVKLAAGESGKQEVIEEQTRLTALAITSLDDRQAQLFLTNPVVSPKVKEALTKAIELRNRMTATQRQHQEVEQQLAVIREDQTRLRANLKEVPPSSAAYKRYVEKFDQQETDVEKLQAQSKQLRQTLEAQRKEFESYLAGLDVE